MAKHRTLNSGTDNARGGSNPSSPAPLKTMKGLFMDPLDTMISAIGNALENKKYFKGNPSYPPPVYMGGGWLIPDWITSDKLNDPEVLEYLKEQGLINEDCQE